MRRLEWRLLELEREQGDVLVVCHQAVGRCLLAYFNGLTDLAENIPYVTVPLHTVIKVCPSPPPPPPFPPSFSLLPLCS